MSLLVPRTNLDDEPVAPRDVAADVYAGSSIRQRFAVPFAYDVHFTEDMFRRDNPTLVDTVQHGNSEQKVHDLTVFVDSGVASTWPNLSDRIRAYMESHSHCLRLTADPMTVPGGEACKNDPEILETLYKRLFRLRLDRHAFILAIGGGAVLDVIGLAAATAHRGIRLIRVPTTVLAQNDSGVGVKVGANRFGAKNFVGAFAPPFAVINDTSFLSTLSSRDRRAGMAEAVKVALIRDHQFFEWMEREVTELAAFGASAVTYLVRRCATLHLAHIATGGDPFETGSARPLDYGHWSAHKLETLTDFELRHGEAVAIGLVLDARYAAATGQLAAGEDLRIWRLLTGLGFRLWHPALLRRTTADESALIQGLEEFREHLGGRLTITLLRRIGEGREVNEMDHEQILSAVHWLEAQNATR